MKAVSSATKAMHPFPYLHGEEEYNERMFSLLVRSIR